MKLKLKATNVYQKNREAHAKEEIRFVVDQGGTRSSKTYSLAQLFVTILLEEHNILLTICRKTFPSLRATAMKDFFNILKEQGLYSESNHNKTEHSYKLGDNEVEFVSIDEPQKIRGRKRTYLWINEANELTYEDFRQLNLRTEKKIYLDYNPSDEFHWIYYKVIPRKDCLFIQSTYLDNPFLDDALVKEIEMLKEADPNYWKIYGLGERGTNEAAIYTHWQYCDKIPDNVDEIIYGLDFGFNNKTALVRVGIKDQDHYCQELLYESHLTNSDLIERLKDLKIEDDYPIYADSAEPQRIEEINKAGFYCLPANKDVKKGIDTIKSHGFYITKDSPNLQKEVKSYKWKQKDERILDEPVKFNDHLLDGARYAAHTHLLTDMTDEDDIDIL
jgi:phage terminase large subunit